MGVRRPYAVLDLFSGYGGFSLAFESIVADACGEGRGAGAGLARGASVGTERDAHRRGSLGDTDAAGLADRPGEHRRIETPSGTGVGGARGPGAFRTIGFSEIDPYACAILAHRWPDVPNLGPVQSVTRDRVLSVCGELPVVVTGGFPCQPHSAAGKRGGSDDERDLWPECWRVLRDLRPRLALFENVPGLLTSDAGLFLNRVCSDLAEIRYACQWQVVSAADIGAPQRRERVWLVCVDELAYRASGGRRIGGEAALERCGRHADGGGAGAGELADGLGARLEGHAGDGDGGDEPGRLASRSSGPVGASRVRPDWPAAVGLWPARPGEPQHWWEPPRVVAGAGFRDLGDTAHDHGRSGVGETEAGTRSDGERGRRFAEPGRVGEVESELGGDVDGSSDRMDATPVQVREVEGIEDSVNRVQRLKAIGNGILPGVAVIFAGAIYDVLEAFDA